jgi:hypothetical protein
MGKFRQWFRNWIDAVIERSLQRQADKQFLKGVKSVKFFHKK